MAFAARARRRGVDTSPAYRAALADRNRARARAAQQAAAAEALKAEEKRRAEQALALESARARDYEAFEMSFLDAERHVDPDDMDLVARAGYLELRTAYVQRWAEDHLGVHLDEDQAL